MERRERSLTLVEGLLIAAILVVLVGLVLTSVDAARERAKSVRCVSNLQLLSKAFSMYATDWGGAFPANLPRSRERNEWESPWPSRIAPYLHYDGALRCPDDPGPLATKLDAPRSRGHVTSYPMNPVIGSPRSGVWAGVPNASKLNDIKMPHETLLLTDRDAWHFRQSRRNMFRFVLFVDGKVAPHRDEEVRDKYWGQLGAE